ncbi:MAG: RNA-binding S4 domain-containing protein [Burkholderiales bacterium]|nr:RNA-binding S4 domain-containing protein [Burkholderiales bacterium]
MARLDKWLWAARFFKTRSVAQQAVAAGKVKVNGERAKPAKDLRVGDELTLQIGETSWTLRVEQLSEQRGPATVARNLYSEDEASRARREEAAALRRLSTEPARERVGRPTKQERRAIDRLRRG